MNNLSQTPERTAAPSGWIKRRLLPALSLAAVIAIAVTVYLTFGLHPERLASFQQWVYGGAFLISLIGNASVVLPVAVMVILAGIGSTVLPAYGLAGPILVGLAGGAGAGLGEITGYLAGYGGGTPFARAGQHKMQAAYERLMRLMETRGSLLLFLLSAVLNPFFYPAALAAGALRFGIQRYFLICWLGKTIKGITVAGAGYWGLGSLLRLLGVPI